MTKSVLCVKCGKWIHGRCTKVKRVTLRLGRDFVCGGSKKQVDGLVEQVEELCEEVETMRGFGYIWGIFVDPRRTLAVFFLMTGYPSFELREAKPDPISELGNICVSPELISLRKKCFCTL